MARKVLCLDWDRRHVRLLVARVGGASFKLEDAHAHRVPPELDAEDPAALGPFIAECLSKHGVRQRQVIVDVPRDKAVIARLPLPPTPLEELPDVVRFQAIKELPFSIDEAAIDYVTLVEDPAARTATEVLLTAVRKEVLERIKATCIAAKLTPARIGLRPYANLVSVKHLPDMSDKRVLFVDVGPAMTEIDVIRGGALAFTRAANVSVPVLGQDDHSWESSRIAVVGGPASEQAVQDAIQDLVVEVVRSLQAYRATESNVVIDQVLLAGSTGVEPDLAQALEKRLALPTELFNPGMALGLPGTRGAELRGFAAVLGLAWGLSAKGLLEIDFLNPKRVVRRSATIIRRARIMGILAAAAAVAGIAFTYKTYRAEAAAVERIRSENSELRKEVRSIRELGNRVAEWDEWRNEAIWLDHLHAIRNALTAVGDNVPGGRIILKSISMLEGGTLIRLDLIADNKETAFAFRRALNEIEIGGQNPYTVEEGAWIDSSTGEPGFTGETQITLRLTALRELIDPAQVEARRKQREQAAREF